MNTDPSFAALLGNLQCLCAHADLSPEDWVAGSLLRDQDVSLNVAIIQDILGRIVALKNDKNLYEDMLIKNPGYMVAQQ